MNALIFAAGVGERMRPLTNTCPKPLLAVGGQPLIFYHLHALRRAGVRKVVVNLCYLGAQLRDALGNGEAFGLQIVYSQEGAAPLETGGGMLQALTLLDDAPFLAVNGDVYCEYPFAPLIERARRMPKDGALAHLVLIDNPAHHPGGDFVLGAKAGSNAGSTGCETGCAQRLHTCGPDKLTFSGIGAYQPGLLRGLTPAIFKLAPILREAISFGSVTGEHFRGPWVDVGTPERLQRLDAQLRADAI